MAEAQNSRHRIHRERGLSKTKAGWYSNKMGIFGEVKSLVERARRFADYLLEAMENEKHVKGADLTSA